MHQCNRSGDTGTITAGSVIGANHGVSTPFKLCWFITAAGTVTVTLAHPALLDRPPQAARRRIASDVALQLHHTARVRWAMLRR